MKQNDAEQKYLLERDSSLDSIHNSTNWFLLHGTLFWQQGKSTGATLRTSHFVKEKSGTQVPFPCLGAVEIFGRPLMTTSHSHLWTISPLARNSWILCVKVKAECKHQQHLFQVFCFIVSFSTRCLLVEGEARALIKAGVRSLRPRARPPAPTSSATVKTFPAGKEPPLLSLCHVWYFVPKLGSNGSVEFPAISGITASRSLVLSPWWFRLARYL